MRLNRARRVRRSAANGGGAVGVEGAKPLTR